MDKYDLVVIGSGPGGYVSAIRAAQLGMSVALVEKQDLGGVCLNWGCIPTKALLKSAQLIELLSEADSYGVKVSNVSPDLKSMVDRSRTVVKDMNVGVQYLLKKNKVTVVTGTARLAADKRVVVSFDDGRQRTLSSDHVILATGGRPAELPGMEFDGKKIINSAQAMALSEIPEAIAIVGGGAIGVEFAYFFSQIGSKVTIIESASHLVPLEDSDISSQLEKSFTESGISVLTASKVEEVKLDEDGACVVVSTIRGRESIRCEKVLSAVGVTANIENIGLEEAGVIVESGKVRVDEFYKTSVQGIYAIGDLISGPALAHVASAEGTICVEKLSGLDLKTEPLNYDNVPSCIYCQPEISSVGLTEESAVAEGYKVRKGIFPFTASGKARAMGATEGFIKVLYDDKYGGILGAHMIGSNVTELMAGVVTSRALETTWQEIVNAIHPHPTMSESFQEASADAYGEAIHL